MSHIKDKLIIFEKPSGGPFDSELGRLTPSHGGGGGVLITSGSMTWHGESLPNTISGSCLFLMNSDMINDLKFSRDFEGYLFWMSESYIDSLAIDFSRSELLHIIGPEPCLKTLSSNDSSVLTNFIKLIASLAQENENENRNEVIRLLVKALYYKSLSKLSVTASDDVHSQKEQLTKDFFMLVRKYGHQHRDLSFYADKMCITSKYLSSAITKASGKRAHKWLEEATMKKAKHLLKETDNQICIIADTLNFASPADFVRYFRVREGTTPLHYRRSSKY